MKILSCDPGLSGGISRFIDGAIQYIGLMPTIRVEVLSKIEQFDLKNGKKQFIKSGPNKGKPKMKLRRAAKYKEVLDMPRIYSLMQNVDVIVIEAQSCRPGNGSAQCASTMTNYGRLLGVAEVANNLYGSKLVIANPASWKTDMHITMDKDEKKACGSASLVTLALKAKACALAKKLFPKYEFKTPKGKLLDGLCESTLIGQWYINKGNK